MRYSFECVHCGGNGNNGVMLFDSFYHSDCFRECALSIVRGEYGGEDIFVLDDDGCGYEAIQIDDEVIERTADDAVEFLFRNDACSVDADEYGCYDGAYEERRDRAFAC